MTILVMICGACILRCSVNLARQTRLQQGIAGEVLRFHILANSDSGQDQRIKLLVRDRVLAWIEEEMEGEKKAGAKMEPEAGEGTFSSEESMETRADFLEFLSAHLSELEAVADAALEEEGVRYRSSASVRRCYFPARTYGDCTFPAGWYEALRVCLGDAEGHNWWCVLYPRLCFTDSLHAVVGEDQTRKLEEVLTVEEYETLLRQPRKWKISFRWF